MSQPRTVSSQLVIRTADDRDAPQVAGCLAAAFAPYRRAYTAGAFADTVPSPAGMVERLARMTVLVAEDPHGTIIGTVAYEVLSDGEGHLRGMAVLPEHQGTGAAALLLQAAEHQLRRRGARRVTLDTTSPLQRAARFYERCGYTPTGERRDFFGMPLAEHAKELVGH